MSPTGLMDVAGDEAREYIGKTPIVVLDFWAEWCIPCKAVDESLRRLSMIINSPKIAFLRVNVEENPEFAAEYAVLNLPTVIILFNGEEYERITGSISGFDAKVYRILKELLRKTV